MLRRPSEPAPAIVVHHVNVVSLVPVVSPIFRIRINGTEPIPTVLEARIPANIKEREAVDAEIVIAPIVAAVIVVRNTVAVVAPALLPGTVLGFPVVGAMMLPIASLFAFLFMLLL